MNRAANISQNCISLSEEAIAGRNFSHWKTAAADICRMRMGAFAASPTDACVLRDHVLLRKLDFLLSPKMLHLLVPTRDAFCANISYLRPTRKGANSFRGDERERVR